MDTSRIPRIGQHPRVPHPAQLAPVTHRASERVLDWVTDHLLASPVVFYAAFTLPLLVLPMSDSVKLALSVISGSWFQWWALPALQRRQNQADAKRDAKADADHMALTHIATAVDTILAAVTPPVALPDAPATPVPGDTPTPDTPQEEPA